MWIIADINLTFNLYRWDYVTLGGKSTNPDFVYIVIVINHVIFAGLPLISISFFGLGHYEPHY